jgi:hypothetical protein
LIYMLIEDAGRLACLLSQYHNLRMVSRCWRKWQRKCR